MGRSSTVGAAWAICLAGLMSLDGAGDARAQPYPSRAVRLIVGTAAGSAPDTIARWTAQWLSDRLGQPLVIENRPGAGGNIAIEAVARATPDGYMLLLIAPSAVINATLYPKLNYNFSRDIAPIGSVFLAPEALMVHPSVPVRTLQEFVAYAKANPGRLNMGSSGNGSGSHIAGEEFMLLSGTKFAHVPYRGGGQVITDLIGGQIQLTFLALGLGIEQVRGGKILALGVSTAKRSPAAPHLPAIAEAVPGYDFSTWFGIGAPRATPTEIVRKLNAELNSFLADANTKARLLGFGGEAFPGSAEDFEKFLAEQGEKKGKVVIAAGIKLQ